MKHQGLSLIAYFLSLWVNFNAFGQSDTDRLAIAFPLKHLKQTSRFGWRIHPLTGKTQFHQGVDLAARHDTVFCILDGIVKIIGYNTYIGNYIIITHSGDVESIYGHLSVISVLPNEEMMAGQPIGITGATGRVTGEHLHFSIKYHGQELSPLAFLCGLVARPP